LSTIKDKAKTKDELLDELDYWKSRARTAERKVVRHPNNLASLVESAEEIYKSPYSVSPPRFSGNAGTGELEIPIFHLTDTQIGKIINSYNFDIADERITEFFRRGVRITNLRRNMSKIKEARVYLGGDMIEGESIFPHQPHTIEPGGVFTQAIKIGPAIVTKNILYLMKHFETIKIIAQPGNHGRNGSKSHGAHPLTNWDRVFYEYLKLQISDQMGNEKDRVKFIVCDKPEYVDYVFDWGNLLIHGDQIGGGAKPFPVASVARAMLGWATDAGIPHWDNMFMGHFHTNCTFPVNNKFCYGTGSTESGSDWVRSVLKASGYPTQRVVFMNRSKGVISDDVIYLGDRVPAKLSR